MVEEQTLFKGRDEISFLAQAVCVVGPQHSDVVLVEEDPDPEVRQKHVRLCVCIYVYVYVCML